MSKRTLGIVITILSLVLCCLPGAVLAAASGLGFLGMLSTPPLPEEDEFTTSICLGGMLCAGGILMLLPLAIGLWAWRSQAEEEPAIEVTYVPLAEGITKESPDPHPKDDVGIS